VSPGPWSYVDELFGVQPSGGSGPLGGAVAAFAVPFSSLPTIRGKVLLGATKGGAEVVLRAGGAPLLVSWQVGRGKVALLGTDGLHRWTFSPRGAEEGEKAQQALWGAMVDWLTEVRDDRPVVAEFERDQYQMGTPARLLVQVTDPSFQPVTSAQVTAELQPARGVRVQCTPLDEGRYEALIATDSAGPLRVVVTASLRGKRLGTDSASTDVIPALAELLYSRPRPELLRRLAVATGGETMAPSALAAAADRLTPQPVEFHRQRTVDRARGPWMLLVVLALWTVDWALRRRWYGG